MLKRAKAVRQLEWDQRATQLELEFQALLSLAKHPEDIDVTKVWHITMQSQYSKRTYYAEIRFTYEQINTK